LRKKLTHDDRMKLVNFLRVIVGCVIIFYSFQLFKATDVACSKIVQFSNSTEDPYNKSIKDTIAALDRVDMLIEKTQKDNEQLTKLMTSTRESIKAIRELNKSSGVVGENFIEGAKTMPELMGNIAGNCESIEKALHAAGMTRSGPLTSLTDVKRSLFSMERTVRDVRSLMSKQSENLRRDLPQVEKDYKSSTLLVEVSLRLYETQIESWEKGPVKQMPQTLESIQTQLHSTIELLQVSKDFLKLGKGLSQDMKSFMSIISVIFAFIGLIAILGGLSQLMPKKSTH